MRNPDISHESALMPSQTPPALFPAGPHWVMAGRIPCLDGLRAVAIALVLFGHGSTTIVPSPPGWLKPLNQGGLGVDIFFVISGFLITILMLRECDRDGSVSLRKFYSRRALRILPALFAYLGFIFLLSRMDVIRVDPLEWVAAMTFSMNFMPNLLGRWDLGHLWSLSVEEHFYIVWPCVFVSIGPRAARAILLMVVACAPAIRYLIWFWMEGRIERDTFTLTRFDTIAMGCLLAFFVRDPAAFSLATRHRGQGSWGVAVAIGILALSMSVLCRSGKYEIALSRTVEAAAIAAATFFLVMGPNNLIGRILDARPVAAMGVLSYSLYLWQQPFLHAGSPHWFSQFPTNFALTAIAAVASFYLVESPFLRLKRRMGV